MKRILFAVFIIGIAVAAQDEPTCYTSENCNPDQCIVTDEHGGTKCVKRQYSVMVWDAECLSSVKIGRKTKLEAPMTDGAPDMSKAKMVNVEATFKTDCGHIEVRNSK